MTYTVEELKEVLRKHLLWLQNDMPGERADLGNANLRDADLRYANLSYANLRNADLRYVDLGNADKILIGQDIRGYLFWAFVGDSGAVEICAGCRHFIGISAAREHWTARHQADKILHEDCLSLVDRCERMAKAREWKLAPEVKP